MIKKMYNQPGQRSTVNWSTVNGQLTRQRATSASKSASTSAVTQRYVSTRRSSSPARCSGDGRLLRRDVPATVVFSGEMFRRQSSSPVRCSGDGRLLRRGFRRRSSSPASFPVKFSGYDKENSQRWQCGLKEVLKRKLSS